ncbi:SWIM zinc finger family protein [Amycolatopsis benzoatilytica]|uniref:SWIM zinc finger family protein n=1 Tax=Amycolatopsis benzoatilytica TaxID=346045 RepID=UPI000366DBD5|nr:SWIM zinc finger family protein [Amycolatopsis benzoatilytica]
MPPRRTFGNRWWGRAWLEALEQRASLDPNRLPRGRTYARKGVVHQLTISSGEISAWVQGSRADPYRVVIRMRQFDDREWDKLLDVAGRRLGHAAALLDGELPEELAVQSREAGADLLPGPGDLRPRCSCPDTANPCKHVAAVYYLVADEVDADPFVLFTLRGRARDSFLAQLRELRAPAAARPARPPDVGLTPKKAYARRVAPLPPRPAIPAEPGRPAVLDLDPPARTGWTAAALAALAADAAALAFDLLHARDSMADLTLSEDLARRAARPGADVFALAAAAELAPSDLIVSAQAWREAGRGGLAALRDVWSPGPGPLAAARAELAELAGEVKVWRNRVTAGAVQLRYGKDGRWYRFVRVSGQWWPDGPPAESPVDVGYPPDAEHQDEA